MRTRGCQERAARRLQNCLGSVIVSVEATGDSRWVVQREWGAPVANDLQTKLEKYERKAANYKNAADQAKTRADRALYQGLAGYCDDLATQFREVIAKRADPFVAVE